MARLLISQQVEQVFWHRLLAAHVLRGGIQDKDWIWFLEYPNDVIYWCDAACLDPINVYNRIKEILTSNDVDASMVDKIIEGIDAGFYRG